MKLEIIARDNMLLCRGVFWLLSYFCIYVYYMHVLYEVLDVLIFTQALPSCVLAQPLGDDNI